MKTGYTEVMLAIQCEDCHTEYVPRFTIGPVYKPTDASDHAEREVKVRLYLGCPACKAVGNMLHRAGLRGVASQF